MIELTEQQRRELEGNGENARVVNPATREEYVLVRAHVYERMQALASDDPEAMYPLLAELDPEDWEDRSAYGLPARMNNHRGDVVLLDYPFVDGSGSKIRPALIVQSDTRNAKINQTIVAMITKNLSRIGIDPTQAHIDLTTSEGKPSGLRVNSAVVCGNLYSVHERHIVATVGRISGKLMHRVNDCLRAALELP